MIAAAAPPIVVCDRCAIKRLDRALEVARSGTQIVVHGEQRGNFVVRVPVSITGAPDAVLDGEGRGTVITIEAPGVTMRDLAIRNSGADFVAMDAAVRSNAPHTTLRALRISNTLFGVYLAHADYSIIEGVHVIGRGEIPIPQRGDGLRLWYSSNVRIADNTVQDARDNLVWFSKRTSILNNRIANGRYGIHTMFSDGLRIASNVVQNCEVGSYAMYTQHLRVEHNLFVNNRGSTGYGIGLKSIDNSVVENNAFVSNHAGIYLDNAPSLVDSTVVIENNLLAYNETGITSLPSSRGDVVLGNTFLENYRQVSVLGGGTLAQMTWSHGQRGNYWSDYAGYDRNNNGTGDIPYETRSAYGALADLDDRLELLVYSPAARAIDFAANALPIFVSPPALTDISPAMRPRYPQGVPAIAPPHSRAAYASIGALALAVSFGVLIPLRPRLQRRKRERRGRGLIEVHNLRKRFGKTVALDGVDLKIASGETLALWGPNGSGKTTLIRCLLGIVRCEGEIAVPDSLGYVPQQLPAFDMRVGEFAAFIAALRGVPADDSVAALDGMRLFDLRERAIADLSGGQRQRLAVALAGLGDPDVLLLDEPTVGLDLESREAIMLSLKEAKERGKTAVIASHVPEDLTAIADRIVVMQEGRIDSILTPAEFTAMIQRRRDAAS